MISNNLTDKITAGACTNSNFANDVRVSGEFTGGTCVGPASIDEVGCFTDPGREGWLRFTVRPFVSAR